MRELIEILDYVRPILQQDRIGLHPATVDELYALFVYQRHRGLVGKRAIAALAIYDEDREALKTRIAVGPGDHLVVRRKGDGVLQTGTIPADEQLVIARAIVENGLKGWKDWRYAKDPQRWIGRVARDIASDIAVEEPPTHNQETGDWELTEPVEIAFGTPAESDSRCTIIRLYHFDLLRSEAQRQSRHRVVDYIDRL